MSRVFIVPDVHLKPWIFGRASKLIREGSYDEIVLLGDLVDDWGEEYNLELYEETFDAAAAFVTKYPNTRWCYGNHDVSYLWEARESGYSAYARETVVRRVHNLEQALAAGRSSFIFRIDEVLFSHAGLTKSFAANHFALPAAPSVNEIDEMLLRINRMGRKELWEDDSPIWARPQYGEMELYPELMLQVVGHTPVESLL
ncbi:MAG: metallophosphoesterase, partial [Lachnospiraceae bacterium]|nr:metallophosphoesterase [Lachnospiraceae bacterium]